MTNFISDNIIYGKILILYMIDFKNYLFFNKVFIKVFLNILLYLLIKRDLAQFIISIKKFNVTYFNGSTFEDLRVSFSNLYRDIISWLIDTFLI